MWRHRKRSSKFKEAKLNQVQFCFSAVKLLKSFFFFLDIVSRYSLQFISAKSWEISMKENQNLFFGVFCFSCFLFKHLSNKNAAQMKMYWCCCHGFPVSNALITLFHCNYTHCCCIPVGFLHLSEDTWGHLVRQSRRCFLGCEKSQELWVLTESSCGSPYTTDWHTQISTHESVCLSCEENGNVFCCVFEICHSTFSFSLQLCAVFLHSCHFGCWLIISFLSCNSFFIILLFVPF